MSRSRLPDRRHAETISVPVVMGEKNVNVLVTFGFDRDQPPWRVTEMFCADFKAGSEYHRLTVDTCIMASRLFQHGVTARDLFASMGDPPSLIASLLSVAARLEAEEAA